MFVIDCKQKLAFFVFSFQCMSHHVSVVALWENKPGYYDLNSQGRETCHMETKEAIFYIVLM